MHLSELLVNARAGLSSAEYAYSQGLKGNAAQDIASLSSLIQNELQTEPVSQEDAAQESAEQNSKETQ